MKLIGCDFDKTIYRGNSSIDFFMFCAKKRPDLYNYYARHAANYFLYFIGKKTWTETSTSFFRFMDAIDEPEKVIEAFWDAKQHKIGDWFYELDMNRVIILSGTGKFLLDSLAKRLGYKYWLGTIIDIHTGEASGENNTGIHKYNEFKRRFPDVELEAFYSDSNKDLPLAQIAERAYRVRRGRVKEWHFRKKDARRTNEE